MSIGACTGPNFHLCIFIFWLARAESDRGLMVSETTSYNTRASLYLDMLHFVAHHDELHTAWAELDQLERE